MRAHRGNWLVVDGGLRTERPRIGVVTDVYGAGDEPPYLVRWLHERGRCIVFPGPGVRVVSTRPRVPRGRRAARSAGAPPEDAAARVAGSRRRADSTRDTGRRTPGGAR